MSPRCPKCDVLAASVLAVFVAIAAASAVAAAESTSTSSRDQLEELQRLAKDAGLDLGLSAWDVSTEFEFGAGYDNNVGLSAFSPDGSALLRGNASALAWRLPDDGFDWLNYADLTYTHYFSSAETDRAVLAILGTEARWTGSEHFEYELAARYTYQDEVLDVSSAFDDQAQFLQARLQSVMLEPSVRWKIAPAWSLEATPRAERLDLIDSSGDQTEFELELALAHRFRRAGTTTLFAGHVARDYGDREQLNSSGNVIAGSRLDVTQTWGALSHEIRWGQRVKWRAKVKAALLRNSDNGEGWYDYSRRGVTGLLTADAGAWHVEVDGGVRHYRYRLQTAFVFGNPPPRRRTGTDVTVRVEREFSEVWSAFVECTAERSASNDPFLEYDNFVTILGLRLSR